MKECKVCIGRTGWNSVKMVKIASVKTGRIHTLLCVCVCVRARVRLEGSFVENWRTMVYYGSSGWT